MKIEIRTSQIGYRGKYREKVIPTTGIFAISVLPYTRSCWGIIKFQGLGEIKKIIVMASNAESDFALIPEWKSGWEGFRDLFPKRNWASAWLWKVQSHFIFNDS